MPHHIEIPPSLTKFFWDADVSQLKFPEHQNYVLGKLMLYGDVPSIQWILRTFNQETVRRYIETKGERTLDKNSFRFWNKVLRMDDLWR
jgi:hypothetical protein